MGLASPSTGSCAMTLASRSSDRSVASSGRRYGGCQKGARPPRGQKFADATQSLRGPFHDVVPGGAVDVHIKKRRSQHRLRESSGYSAPGGSSDAVRLSDRRDPAVFNHDHRIVMQALPIPQLCCRIYHSHEWNYCRRGDALSRATAAPHPGPGHRALNAKSASDLLGLVV